MYYVSSPHHTSNSAALKNLYKKVKTAIARGEEHVEGTLIGDAFFPTTVQAKRL